MRWTTIGAALLGATVPVSLWAGSLAFQSGPTLGASGNAQLYDFTNGTTADATAVNNNFSLVRAAVNDNDSRLQALEALLARVSCDNVSFVAARTYPTLNSQLDADYTGAGVCGAGKHVCNAQEVAQYAGLGNCSPPSSSWIVGGFSNTDFHRRAGWNGQDSVQCMAGNYPAWWIQWAGYDARVHCETGTASKPVACCIDQ